MGVRFQFRDGLLILEYIEMHKLRPVSQKLQVPVVDETASLRLERVGTLEERDHRYCHSVFQHDE